MAKYCGNCGNQLEDTARVCGYCGKPFDDMPQNIAGVDYKNPESKGKVKKIIKRIVIIIIVAGMAFAGAKVATEVTGAKGMVRSVMKAYENYDIDGLVEMSSDVWFYEMADYVENYFESGVGNDLDYYETSVGHNYKFSYEISEIYEPSERRLVELEEDVQQLYVDFDMGMIEKVKIAHVKTFAEKGGKTVNRDVVLTLTKENGEWRVLYME